MKVEWPDNPTIDKMMPVIDSVVTEIRSADFAFTGEWTLGERILLIALIAAHMRERAMSGFQLTDFGSFNSETVFVIAVAPSDWLQKSIPLEEVQKVISKAKLAVPEYEEIRQKIAVFIQ